MTKEDQVKEFREIFENRYTLLKERKEKGQRIIGWMCTYVPEEIIHAAGILPIRIMGNKSDEVPIATAHLYSNVCFFVRSCVEDGFRGNYDFLDGFIAINACDHMRRGYDVWSSFLKTPYTDILGVPCKVSDSTLDFFHQDLVRIKKAIESNFHVEITDEALRRSIALFNRTRQLLRELYELRKSDAPPISGADSLDILLAGLVMPKEEYNVKLDQLLAKLKGQKGQQNGSIRLMITGSELDDSDYLRAIESWGASIVVDDLCNGTRYFWDLVEESGDPLRALAQRYLDRTPCARMRPQDKRVKHLQQLAREYRVEGAIYEAIKFCGPYGGVLPIIKKGLKELDLPLLSLQRDYSMSGVGQMKTRVQAFLEQIGG